MNRKLLPLLLALSGIWAQDVVFWEPEIPVPGGDITIYYNVVAGTLPNNANPVGDGRVASCSSFRSQPVTPNTAPTRAQHETIPRKIRTGLHFASSRVERDALPCHIGQPYVFFVISFTVRLRKSIDITLLPWSCRPSGPFALAFSEV